MLLWKVSVRAEGDCTCGVCSVSTFDPHALDTAPDRPRKAPGSQRYRVRDDTLLPYCPLGLIPHYVAHRTMVVTS